MLILSLPKRQLIKYRGSFNQNLRDVPSEKIRRSAQPHDVRQVAHWAIHCEAWRRPESQYPSNANSFQLALVDSIFVTSQDSCSRKRWELQKYARLTLAPWPQTGFQKVKWWKFIYQLFPILWLLFDCTRCASRQPPAPDRTASSAARRCNKRSPHSAPTPRPGHRPSRGALGHQFNLERNASNSNKQSIRTTI